MAELPAGSSAVSGWTEVEFASLLARDVRMGDFDRRIARNLQSRFDSIVSESFVVLLPNADDFALAKRYLGTDDTGLQGGDALHLAIARNHGADIIDTLDKALLKAGQALGLNVFTGIRIG